MQLIVFFLGDYESRVIETGIVHPEYFLSSVSILSERVTVSGRRRKRSVNKRNDFFPSRSTIFSAICEIAKMFLWLIPSHTLRRQKFNFFTHIIGASENPNSLRKACVDSSRTSSFKWIKIIFCWTFNLFLTCFMPFLPACTYTKIGFCLQYGWNMRVVVSSSLPTHRPWDLEKFRGLPLYRLWDLEERSTNEEIWRNMKYEEMSSSI